MIQGFDRIVIDVPDLPQATEEYTGLLGAFSVEGDSAIRSLGNVAVELRESPEVDQAQIAGLVFLDDALPAGREELITHKPRGLNLRRIGPGGRTTPSDPETPSDPTSDTPSDPMIAAVDHVVLRTGDADDCIAEFGDGGLGLRLALDQLVPEWGGRMLFFRCGKLTLEVIHNLDQPPESDSFWGITYLCPNLEATLSILDRNGVLHSEPRKGRKPGTRVATIKSHHLGLPTLLIEPVA